MTLSWHYKAFIEFVAVIVGAYAAFGYYLNMPLLTSLLIGIVAYGLLLLAQAGFFKKLLQRQSKPVNLGAYNGHT